MDLLTLINNGMQNPFLDTIVPVIYDVTDAIAIPTLFVILFLASWILKKEKLKEILAVCLLSLFITLVIVLLLKSCYTSPRPYTTLSHIRPVIPDNGFNSFPSGHVAMAMTIITVLLMKIRNSRPILIILCIIYASIIAFTVLYGGVHYPIDVLVGGVIGVLSAVAAVQISKIVYPKFQQFL